MIKKCLHTSLVLFSLTLSTIGFAEDSTSVSPLNLTPHHKGYVLTRGTDSKLCDKAPCFTTVNTPDVCLSTHSPEVLVAPLSSVYNKGRPIRRYVIKNPKVMPQGGSYVISFQRIFADEYGGIGNEFITFNYTILCV